MEFLRKFGRQITWFYCVDWKGLKSSLLWRLWRVQCEASLERILWIQVYANYSENKRGFAQYNFPVDLYFRENLWKAYIDKGRTLYAYSFEELDPMVTAFSTLPIFTEAENTGILCIHGKCILYKFAYTSRSRNDGQQCNARINYWFPV